MRDLCIRCWLCHLYLDFSFHYCDIGYISHQLLTPSLDDFIVSDSPTRALQPLVASRIQFRNSSGDSERALSTDLYTRALTTEGFVTAS